MADKTHAYVALSLTPTRLTALTGVTPPLYRNLWNMVVSGLIPATRINGRWYVLETDIEPIAVMLGMLVPEGIELPAAALQSGPSRRRAYVLYFSINEARTALSTKIKEPDRNKPASGKRRAVST